MDIKEVERLIEIFEASSLSELSLELGNGKLSMKRGGAAQGAVQSMAQQVSGEKPAELAEEKTADAKQGDKKVIKAPFVGTFYRALGPSEKPFVEVGQQIKKGDVVGIVEAMKLMNEITATEDGIVESIEAEDESLVAYGDVLICLR